MKRSPLSLTSLVAALILSVCAGVSAQNTNAPGGPRGIGGPRNIDAQVSRLSQQLSLTEEQKPKVKAILEEQNKKMTEMRGDSATAPQDRRAKMQGIREETTRKMKEVLTAEQFKKYEEFQQQQRTRRPGQGGGQNAPAPSN